MFGKGTEVTERNRHDILVVLQARILWRRWTSKQFSQRRGPCRLRHRHTEDSSLPKVSRTEECQRSRRRLLGQYCHLALLNQQQSFQSTSSWLVLSLSSSLYSRVHISVFLVSTITQQQSFQTSSWLELSLNSSLSSRCLLGQYCYLVVVFLDVFLVRTVF